MFSADDTIVAIATPAGRGGIGVVRLSGPEAHAIALALAGRNAPLPPRHATVATILCRADPRPTTHDRGLTTIDYRLTTGGSPLASNAIDQAVLTYFPAPASYTGDDVVEVSAHGSPVVLRAIVAAAVGAGARVAEPGEFTLRAFVHGRIDLTQAEAVADLVDAVTPLQARAAFDQLQGTLTRAIAGIDEALFDLIARLEASVDFPDEGYHFVEPATLADAIDGLIARTRALLARARRGRMVREGLQIAIVGPPNVGKSSLFNALAGAARAIVTDVPGTTRDLVTETVDLDGLRVTLVDTAGLRDVSDVVEVEGVRRSRAAAATADLVLYVVDASISVNSELDVTAHDGARRRLIVLNKSDLVGPDTCAGARQDGAVSVSALTGAGIEGLRTRIRTTLDLGDGDLFSDPPEITNVRHIALVERAEAALLRARHAALPEGESLPEEFVLADLQEARAALEEVTGRRAPEELLRHIFERFCVGK